MAKHIAMLNLDMIGNLGQKKFSAQEIMPQSIKISGPNKLQSFIDELNGRYPLTRWVVHSGKGVGGGSDHVPFHNKGVPIAFFHTGTSGPYHRPEDDADRLNYDGCEKISRYAFELAWKLAQSDDKASIDLDTFQMIKSTHDHEDDQLPFGESTID